MEASTLESFRREVEGIFGADLVSLTVYGSHAGGEPEKGSEVSVLVVVSDLRRESLSAYRDVASGFARKGIPPPVIFTEAFFRNSLDVFPLEFLSMSERRKVLSGRDVLEGLAISEENLRHQVEFELKAKLLSLTRMYMKSPGRKETAGIAPDTVGSLVSVARGLLLLAGREAPHDKEEIVSALEARFGVRLAAMREALAARRGAAIPRARAEESFFAYLDEVRALCDLADRFLGGAPG
jgi:hypothetical protein